MERACCRRAFSLIELLVVILVIALLVAMLMPALANARRAAREVKCRVYLSQYCKGMFYYQNDFKDRVATYSWRRGAAYRLQATGGMTPTINSNDFEAAVWQMEDIGKVKARFSPEPSINPKTGLCPFPNLSPMMMVEYLTNKLPEPTAVCPEDRLQLQWAENPTAPTSRPPEDQFRWARSSYQMSMPFWGVDNDVTGWRMRTGPTSETLTWTGPVEAGRRKWNEVRFPSQKVLFYEKFSRHARQQLYFLHPDADGVVALADGSVRRVLTREANTGGYIAPGGGVDPGLVEYIPNASRNDPAWPGGYPTRQPPRYMMTLRGLKGIDIGGREAR